MSFHFPAGSNLSAAAAAGPTTTKPAKNNATVQTIDRLRMEFSLEAQDAVQMPLLYHPALQKAMKFSSKK
jgi:hypothetical protein